MVWFLGWSCGAFIEQLFFFACLDQVTHFGKTIDLCVILSMISIEKCVPFKMMASQSQSKWHSLLTTPLVQRHPAVGNFYTLYHVRIFPNLYYETSLNEKMRLRLKHLIEMGIVAHVGRNKYVLALSLYNAAGKPGIHTRRVGLDRETNKELLLKHIRDKGNEGSPFRELQQVLPGHNRGEIQVLFTPAPQRRPSPPRWTHKWWPMVCRSRSNW